MKKLVIKMSSKIFFSPKNDVWLKLFETNLKKQFIDPKKRE